VTYVKARDDQDLRIEAAGLDWLRDAGALRVPEVLEVSEHRLVLERIDPGRLDAAGEEELGRGLAALHAAGAPAHGFTPHEGDLQLVHLRLPSAPAESWASFYAESRVLPLLPSAGLSPRGRALVESVCERIEDLAGPEEPPARLHGDLWAGNVLAGVDGRPWLIDPAAHGGHREVDLAMLRLFGGPGERTFSAYAEAAPLAEGHDERVALWQLFPLLVHAVLFGGGYAGSAEHAAARYA